MTLLVPQTQGIPLPRPSRLSAPFWEACAEGRLTYQKCTQCGSAIFNPAPLCTKCHCRKLQWTDSRGLGVVYSWTVAYRPLSPAFTEIYAPAIIDVEEGYQMVSNVIGCSVDDLAVGMTVRVEFHPVGEITLPYFRPSGGDR
ncbi:Zn-ribbon domain-containing OB-fold protein [Mycobacterium sp. NPDC051804]|uniref:Zn-ribbon domain-containing OB-fold protein n=1 Tax=Mycobacterium sp. NPDC051804 TaxID=3364295 RepID=UPI0037A9060A